jgi:hypothetical protein
VTCFTLMRAPLVVVALISTKTDPAAPVISICPASSSSPGGKFDAVIVARAGPLGNEAGGRFRGL